MTRRELFRMLAGGAAAAAVPRPEPEESYRELFDRLVEELVSARQRDLDDVAINIEWVPTDAPIHVDRYDTYRFDPVAFARDHAG